MVYAEEIRNYIFENFLFEEDENLKEDTSLIENGIIDSTGILELVAFVEERYHFTVLDEELVPDNFNSVGSIARFIERKRNGAEV